MRRILVALPALLALILATGAAAQQAGGISDPFEGMLDIGDLGMLLGGGDGGLQDLLASLGSFMSSPLAPSSGAAPAASTAGPTPASSAAMEDQAGQLFAALFSGNDNPFSSFLSAGDGGLSGAMAAFLGGASARPSASAASGPTATSSSPAARSAGGLLAPLLEPLAAPCAAARSVMDELASAIENSRDVLAGSDLGELFPGVELGRFLGGDRQALTEVLKKAEEMEQGMCTPSHMQSGSRQNSTCIGHTFTLAISGGSCTIQHQHKNHTVVCQMPSVRLIKTPGACVVKHTTPTRVMGRECKPGTKEFGVRKQGFLKVPIETSIALEEDLKLGEVLGHTDRSHAAPRTRSTTERLGGLRDAAGTLWQRMRARREHS